MGTIKNFEELEIWKYARELVNCIYADFRSCKDYNFTNQITRAGVSIMNNISEGFCRNSDAEFRQFLSISKGSAGEVKNMYYIAEDQKYISSNIASERREMCHKIINRTGKLSSYLKQKYIEPPRLIDSKTQRLADNEKAPGGAFSFIKSKPKPDRSCLAALW